MLQSKKRYLDVQCTFDMNTLDSKLPLDLFPSQDCSQVLSSQRKSLLRFYLNPTQLHLALPTVEMTC